MSHIIELCHFAADVPDILLKPLLVKVGFDVAYLPQGLNGVMHRQEPCSKEKLAVQKFTRRNTFKVKTIL